MDRNLTGQERDALIHNGCMAEDWQRIRVKDGFSPDAVTHTVFSGTVSLGVFDAVSGADGAFPLPAGIRDSRIRNVDIGDNCRLVNATVQDAVLGEGCLVENTTIAHHANDTPFGLMQYAHVLAEDGARQVPLWNGLSAQLAHLLCHLQLHPVAEQLLDMMAADVLALDASRSRLGRRCRIRNAGRLDTVWLGEGTVVEHAAGLDNCYAADEPGSPVRILEGVRADNTVFLAGSRVDGGTRLSSCLVGEGVSLDKAFAAKHSLFFANSEFLMGEAACAMAGPFAVSHHKATLVLTCQCSFNTFGSAANSSNHHFKLGPRHGGVMRRGARCGSGSYLFWPADIGAFSTVVGKHTRHIDTADFPFSLLTEKNGETVLVPGVNLFGAGMVRDGAKWCCREKRDGVARPLDSINAAILSPYVMQAIDKSIRFLRRSQALDADIRHNGAIIPAQRIAPALQIYENGMTFYLGECLLRAVRREKGAGGIRAGDFLAVIRRAAAGAESLAGEWRDWGGMLLSGGDADAFRQDVLDGSLATLEAVRQRLEQVHGQYEAKELGWAAARWQREYGDDAGTAVVVDFIRKWRRAVRYRYESLIRDVGKEFTREVMYGFGIEESAVGAFRRVRGDPAEVELVMAAKAERDALLAAVDEID